jgi:hypothetical protein
MPLAVPPEQESAAGAKRDCRKKPGPNREAAVGRDEWRSLRLVRKGLGLGAGDRVDWR